MASQEPKQYDLISIGSGEAGKYIAWTLASKGWKCAVVEREYYGGSCPNVACLPSKNVIHSAKVASLAASQKQLLGLSASGGQVDMQAVKQRKDHMIEGLMDLHHMMFDKTKVPLFSGEGKFVGPKTVEVKSKDGKTSEVLTADKIILCTGSTAAIPDVPGLKNAGPLTHVEMLNITELPKNLIIFGGGYVGLEFAQAMRRLGAQVTVVESSARVLKREDEDVVGCIQSVLEAEGVAFSTATTVDEVSGKSGDAVTLKCKRDGASFTIAGSHILCATGRIPNTDLSASVAGVELTKSGHFAVDEHNRTTADGIFAVGDCANSPHFTHIGFDDFRIVRDVLTGTANEGPRRSARQVPFTLFTDPEVAHVGLREHEAVSKGVKYRLTKAPMMAFLRTRTLDETTGFAKALIGEDDTILGFTAVGPGAGELLPVVQLAMKKNLPYTDIAELVITHPTLSEGLVSLFGSVPAKE